MNNVVIVNKNSRFTIDEKVHNYLNPDFVYLPINDYNVSLKSDERVFKEQVVLKKDDKKIYSPISGTIVGKTNSVLFEDEVVSSIVIENDFKEELKKRKGCIKYINEYTKEEIIDLLTKYNELDGIDFNQTNNLIVNCIDHDPFENTMSYYINTHIREVLETVDALQTILGIKNVIIAINNGKGEDVMKINNNIGTYPNIKFKLLPDHYPNGFNEILVTKLLNKKEMNEGYNILNIIEVYDIYTVLKRNKAVSEHTITIGGNAISDSFMLNVKIGTSIFDIIKNNTKIISKDYAIVKNGLISGKTILNPNNLIDKNTRSIFVHKKDKQKEAKCINCGLCNIKCPVKANPKYMLEHKNASKDKCIKCGICTYVCPAKINFKKHLGGNNE